MKISKKDLEQLNKEGIITAEQVEQIMKYYQVNSVGSKLWVRLFIISGLLISLGIVLIIGANWNAISYMIKLLVDFVLFLVIVYADYYFIVNDKKNLAETFLTISFFMVAGSIGLISQVYNLDGGWFSFARWWMILSIPFVFLSKNKLINILWITLLLNSLPDGFYTYMKDSYTFVTTKFLPFSKDINVSIVLGFVYICLELIKYCSLLVYKKLNNKILLPKSFSFVVTILMIFIAVMLAVLDKNVVSIVFICCLLSYKVYYSYKTRNLTLLRNSAVLIELYIIFLFVSAYRNLFFTGVGFIIGGTILLVSIYVLRRILNYVKQLENFK